MAGPHEGDMSMDERTATAPWWQGQMTVCWHPESPGVRVYVWRSWWRKRRPFASLREMRRYYRPDFHAVTLNASTPTDGNP